MTSDFCEQEVRMFEKMTLSPAQYNASTLKAFPAFERASPRLLVEVPREIVSQAPGWENR